MSLCQPFEVSEWPSPDDWLSLSNGPMKSFYFMEGLWRANRDAEGMDVGKDGTGSVFRFAHDAVRPSLNLLR